MNGLWTLIPAVGMYVAAICIVISAARVVLEQRKPPP